MHVLHLNKSGSGMASVTACGRNILRTPFSASWNEYKTAQGWTKCAKCEASKQAELNRRTDAKNAPDVAAPVEPDAWEPEADANAWIGRDAEMIAAAKTRGVTLSLNERITAQPAVAPGEPLAVMALAGRINRECLDWLEIPGTDGELMLVAMPHGVVTMFTDMNGYATPEECYSAAPHLHRIVAPSWNAYVVDLTKRAAPECVAVLHAVMYEPNAEVMARAVEVVRNRRLTAEYLAVKDGDDDNPSGILNHYTCYACAYEWSDEWDCGCDDDCPECGARHCSPHTSEEVKA